MNRSNLAFGAIIAATLVVGTALLFALDAIERLLTDNNTAARAFILSDAFWPAVIGFTLVLLILLLAATSSYAFHPDRLTGRNVPERGQ